MKCWTFICNDDEWIAEELSLEAAAFHFGGSSSGGDDTETDGMNFEAKKDPKEDDGDGNGIYSYQPVEWHWFYLKNSEPKSVWQPFSVLDSVALEEMYHARKLHYALFSVYPLLIIRSNQTDWVYYHLTALISCIIWYYPLIIPCLHVYFDIYLII